jgi:hypothetical protein
MRLIRMIRRKISGGMENALDERPEEQGEAC